MTSIIYNFLRLLPELRQHPAHSAQITFDEEADVLYVNYEPGIAADDSDEIEEDVIGSFKDGWLIGYTILNVSLQGMRAEPTEPMPDRRPR